MFDIRVANVEDYSVVREMAMKFYAISDHASAIPWDEESAQLLFCDMVANGFILLASVEEKCVGMLGCMVTPAPLNKNHKIATEFFWWVEPEYRKGRLGIKLVQAGEHLAKYDGCTIMVMSVLNVSPDGVERVLEHLGYHWKEKSLVKEL